MYIKDLSPTSSRTILPSSGSLQCQVSLVLGRALYAPWWRCTCTGRSMSCVPRSRKCISCVPRSRNCISCLPRFRNCISCVPRSRNCISCVPSCQPQKWRVASHGE